MPLPGDQPRPSFDIHKANIENKTRPYLHPEDIPVPADGSVMLFNPGHSQNLYELGLIEKVYDVGGQRFGTITVDRLFATPAFKNADSRKKFVDYLEQELRQTNIEAKLEVLGMYAQRLSQPDQQEEMKQQIQKTSDRAIGMHKYSTIQAKAAEKILSHPKAKSFNLETIMKSDQQSYLNAVRTQIDRLLGPKDASGKRALPDIHTRIAKALHPNG